MMRKIIFNIDIKRCKGCGLCTTACPKHLLVIDKDTCNPAGDHPAKIVDVAECIGCANCAITCPDVAITLGEEE